ncbi:MAG TPA: hypothetical protein VI386_33550 [Candidatus Sulfotelmatobacter sp.]
MSEPAPCHMQDESAPSVNYSYPEWQPLVQAALIELDPQQLPGQIEAAEAAVANRLQAIGFGAHHHAERLAISDAIASLRFLRREQASRRGDTAKPD